MNCDEIFNRICDDLSEDINSQVCLEIKNHIKTCSKCRAQLMSMKNAVNLFKCLEDKVVPTHVHERLLKMLNVLDQSEA
ncbi:hypothetical protein JXQ31_03970 [candidate division KSB1 bacterium]|nr:hypothetical protein [candidate division KSB1 bacterium]